jgi:hypothetical protein
MGIFEPRGEVEFEARRVFSYVVTDFDIIDRVLSSL